MDTPRTCRRRICLGKTVQELECQIEWQDPMPVVVDVKPGGEAHRQGVCPGDAIAFLNDMHSLGKNA